MDGGGAPPGSVAMNVPRDVRPDDAVLLGSLGDPVDRCILEQCLESPHPVRDIVRECDLAQSTAYRHIDRMVEEGLLYVAETIVNEEGKRTDLFRSAVRSLQVRLQPAGTRVQVDFNDDAVGRLLRTWRAIKEGAGSA